MKLLPIHFKVKRYRDDLPLFAAQCLKIKPKKPGPLIALKFNRVQLYLHERIEEQLARRGFVRIIILKGRQTTISTYVGARYYHKTSLREGFNTYILSYAQDSTDILFEIVNRFWENSPFRPQTDTSNAKELRFDLLHGGYAVGTAGSTATGRSGSIQLLQGDECAYWKNAPLHFAGVVQAVPLLPGTEVILLSTANGMGNEFHGRWQQAEAGIGDYEAIFLPWYWAEDYRLPVPDGFVPTEEEQQFLADNARSRWPPTVETLVWRRAKIEELRDKTLFMQEFPATPMEAFMFTGQESFIRPVDVVLARKAALEGFGPLIVGADPARFGDDRFSLAWRQGRKVSKIESRSKLDVVAGAGWIKSVIDHDRPARVFIDLGGIGAGTYDILQSWGAPYDSIVVGVNFGDPPQEDEVWSEDGKTKVPGPRNRRAEMWMRFRDWLQQPGGADVPDLDSLQADACGPTYSYDMGQRLLLESKEHMRSRGIRSPDEADSVCLTFAEPVKAPPPTAAPPKRMAPQAGKLAWLGA